MNSNESPTSSNDSATSFADRLYARRDSGWFWFDAAFFSVVVFLITFSIFFFADRSWLLNPGPWTFILVVAGAPIALYVWIVRDRNKAVDIEVAREQQVIDQTRLEQQSKMLEVTLNQQQLDREKLENEQFRHKDQLLHRRAEIVQSQFQQVQEWAAGGKGLVLQAAAIHQLGLFILGDTRVMPIEFTKKMNFLAQPGLEILRALLDDRRWATQWNTEWRSQNPDEFSAPVSPVMRAIERILNDRNLELTNFSGWDLRDISLEKEFWKGKDLANTNLKGSLFSFLDFREVDFSFTDLGGSKFDECELQDVRFMHADLGQIEPGSRPAERTYFNECKLSGAQFQFADLNRARFYSCNLSGAVFEEADLGGVEFQNCEIENTVLPRQIKSEIELSDQKNKGKPRYI